MIAVVIPNPILKPHRRPRLGKGRNGSHVYSPSKKAETNLGWQIKAAILEAYPSLGLPLEGEYDLYAFYYFKGGKKGDTDNYLKFLLEALQRGGIVENDRQIRVCFLAPFADSQADRLDLYLYNAAMLSVTSLHLFIPTFYRGDNDIALQPDLEVVDD